MAPLKAAFFLDDPPPKKKNVINPLSKFYLKVFLIFSVIPLLHVLTTTTIWPDSHTQNNSWAVFWMDYFSLRQFCWLREGFW